MKSEKDKMLAGELYDANFDAALLDERKACKTALHAINSLSPAEDHRRHELLRGLLGKVPERFVIESPFHCDYGYNIFLGENFYMNVNCVVLDEAPVTFGDNVFVAPNCAFYTAAHPFDVEQRNRGLEYGRPITVGDNVWIGGNTVVLPGVTIGEGCVIGAGSVVVKDIPPHSLAVGNPCKVIRKIESHDMKKAIPFIALAAATCVHAQTLEKMNWFNEPAQWNIDGSTLSMAVTPQSDYWRISHYGFTVDDAPFYYAEYGGEFEAKVKISGDYKARFDQAGLMLRIDHENYIKAGIEFVDGKYNISAVVTHRTSDWSVITLDRPVDFIWIKAVRRLDAVEIFYSFDDKEYIMMRNAWMQDNVPMKVGMMGACPDGAGFNATFENFSVKHLPDQRRLQWLKDHAE